MEHICAFKNHEEKRRETEWMKYLTQHPKYGVLNAQEDEKQPEKQHTAF